MEQCFTVFVMIIKVIFLFVFLTMYQKVSIYNTEISVNTLHRINILYITFYNNNYSKTNYLLQHGVRKEHTHTHSHNIIYRKSSLYLCIIYICMCVIPVCPMLDVVCLNMIVHCRG